MKRKIEMKDTPTVSMFAAMKVYVMPSTQWWHPNTL